MEITGPLARRCRRSTPPPSPPSAAVPGTLAASAHQSHAYTDGACLYFTFAGKVDADGARTRYYRAVWDAGTRAVLGRGGALSHHHGVGLNRARFVREALGAGVRRARRDEGRRSTRTASSTRASSACPTRSATSAGRDRPGRDPTMSILVIDVGHQRRARRRRAPRRRRSRTSTTASCCPTRRPPGSSSSTPRRMADGRPRAWPGAVLAEGGPVDAVGIANQRASTIVWDRATGEPVGPGSAGRTCARSATASCSQAEGLRLAPNLSATKVGVAARPGRPRPQPRPVLRHGRHVDRLAPLGGRAARHRPHQRRGHRPASTVDGTRLGRPSVLDALRIPAAMLPTIVDSTGDRRPGHRLDGAPPIAGIVGDQQASLLGQGCVAPGAGQDHLRHRRHARRRARRRAPGVRDPRRRAAPSRSSPGAATATITWGLEAIMLVGRHQRRVAARRPRHHRRPRPSPTTWPPQCDDDRRRRLRARPARPGHARSGTTAPAAPCSASPGARAGPQIVRAVLEGVAQRGADLVDAAEADGGVADRRRCASTAA